MSRIYLASSWRNKYQPSLCARLRAGGHQVYDFRHPFHADRGFAWSELDASWQTWKPEEYRKHLLTNKIAARGYMSDLRAMEWADTCVLLLPSGRSAHLEAGWMKGRGKRTIVHIPTTEGFEPELMNLLCDEITCSDEELYSALAGEPVAC